MAIVMNSAVFFSEANVLKVYCSPVAYWDDDRFEQEMATLAGNIEQNVDTLRSLGEDGLRGSIFNVFKFGVLCSKHPGFEEELEWRLVYSPTMLASPTIIRDVVVHEGTPQTIYKVPLKDIPDQGFVGAEIPQLIDRIIIGPTRFPTLAAEAIAAELTAAGVADAEQRVFISGIPLRR